MSNMRVVDVRTLQHRLGAFLDEVERGEVLEIRRRRRVIARIIPHAEGEPASPWPDLIERLSALYPEGPVTPSATQRLYSDRDET